MKLRIVKTCILHDGMCAVAGQVFDDFPDVDARALIGAGKAEEWQPLTQRLPIPEVIEVREPLVEYREPVRGKKLRRNRSRMP